MGTVSLCWNELVFAQRKQSWISNWDPTVGSLGIEIFCPCKRIGPYKVVKHVFSESVLSSHLPKSQKSFPLITVKLL